MLEPCDGKLSRTVLRGEWSRKAPDPPDPLKQIDILPRSEYTLHIRLMFK